MVRVALIVTGRLEELGLPSALRRLFPNVDVEFVSEYFESFTSNRLSTVPAAAYRPAGIKTNAEKIAEAMMLALDPGRRDTPADFSFALDDLELANDDQPERVFREFRQAVRSRLPILHNTAFRENRAIQQVPLRCSFHVLRPMIEAYFFADQEAIRQTGARREPALRPDRDLEDFEIDDAEYHRIIRDDYGNDLSRVRHPKWYLRWLRDPARPPREKAYRETKNGRAALETLDWNLVLGRPGTCPFLRSFIIDLADALEVPPPVPHEGCHALTARHNPNRSDAVLRNI